MMALLWALPSTSCDREEIASMKTKPGEEGTVIDKCPSFWKFLECSRYMPDQMPWSWRWVESAGWSSINARHIPGDETRQSAVLWCISLQSWRNYEIWKANSITRIRICWRFVAKTRERRCEWWIQGFILRISYAFESTSRFVGIVGAHNIYEYSFSCVEPQKCCT